MARVTPNGVEATTLAEYVDLLGEALRSVLGQDLSLDADTLQGQLIGVFALQLAQQDEALVAVANSLVLSAAEGNQLDAHGSIFNLPRREASHTMATATASGLEGVAVPSGAIVQSDNGDLFEVEQTVLIGADGTASVTLRAQQTGPVSAPQGALTQIVTPFDGWDSITNDEATSTGRRAETDAEYRARYRRLISRNSLGSVGSIKAAVENVFGIKEALVFQNTGSAAQAIDRGGSSELDPHSVMVFVRNDPELAGVARSVGQDTAAAIAFAKPVGVATSAFASAQEYTVGSETIRYRDVSSIEITASLTLQTRSDFPFDGLDRIREDVLAYVRDLPIGRGLAPNELAGPAYRTPGHTVTAVTYGRAAGGITPIDDENVFIYSVLNLTSDNLTITVS